jgi:hypothetical protein
VLYFYIYAQDQERKLDGALIDTPSIVIRSFQGEGKTLMVQVWAGAVQVRVCLRA